MAFRSRGTEGRVDKLNIFLCVILIWGVVLNHISVVILPSELGGFEGSNEVLLRYTLLKNKLQPNYLLVLVHIT